MKHLFNLKSLLGGLLLFAAMFALDSCSDSKESAGGYDPGQPVEITDFSPKEGSRRTALYIYGKNFGTDVSRILVRVGGKDAKVVGCNGKIIYCLVPSQATEGSVEVSVASSDNFVKAAEAFTYISKPQVTTLCGYVDEYGKTEVKDGSFDECGFQRPRWLAVDPEHQDHLYLVDGDPGAMIRVLDVANRRVSTLIDKGVGGWNNIRQISFSETGDTLLVANEEGVDRATAVSILTRSGGYQRPQSIVYARSNNACCMNPMFGELYYNSRTTGELFRYDWATKESKRMCVVQGEDSQYYIFFHPTGKYAYLCVPNKKVIMKSEYDMENHELLSPTVFCGQLNKSGYADGISTNAILGNPMQGVFVKNEKYTGQEDEYDFYFADQYAHAIRYVTPDAYVRTYAGRGSKGLDSNPNGYVDGDLLEEARFNQPQGLIYDDENKIFYVAEYENKRVRMIIQNE